MKIDPETEISKIIAALSDVTEPAALSGKDCLFFFVELQNSTQGIYCNKSGKEICPLVLR